MTKMNKLKWAWLTITCVWALQTLAQTTTTTSRINIRGKNVFLGGMNLAWGNYGSDIVDQTLNTKTFPVSINKISSVGGNAIRWWLHTNGKNGLTIDTATHLVSGISPQVAINVKKVLDMAYAKGVAVSLCLWSFDMLQSQQQDTMAMRLMIEDTAYTNAYIRNALIPLLTAVGDHPAILCWEILNEPDGMIPGGWSAQKTTMAKVQQFTNIMAGAIHRNAPGKYVSSSFASIRNLSDANGFTNFYRDDRLIAAGGDPDGTLDFYQVHFYDDYAGNDFSPFHHPASYWALDKPLVIGEFSAAGTQGNTSPHKSPTECYQYAYDNGYAGALSWAWSGHADANLAKQGITASVVGFNVDSVAILSLSNLHSADLSIPGDTNFYLKPTLVGKIPNFARKYANAAYTVSNHADLKKVFYDVVDGTALNYSVTGYTNPGLLTATIDQNSVLSFEIKETTGSSWVYVTAKNKHSDTVTTAFKVRSVPDNGNLALLRTITASTVEKDDTLNYSANYAVDGDTTTRWSSYYDDNQFFYVNLGSSVAFNKVKIKWEAAYASVYSIQTSNSTTFITNAYSTTSNTSSGWLTHTFTGKTAQYVKLKCTTRATNNGFSVYEFEVYNTTATSVSDPEIEKSISVYPNPATDYVNITAEPNIKVQGLQLTDINGKIIQNFHWNSIGGNSINLGQLPAGVYFVQVVLPQGLVSKKVVK